MPGCTFCEIVKGAKSSHKIYEDEKYLGILDINPIRSGHSLLIPKRHSPYVFGLGNEEYTELFKAAQLLVLHLEKAFDADRIGMLISGISIPHVHVHLIPTYERRDIDPNLAKPASEEELLAVQKLILATF